MDIRHLSLRKSYGPILGLLYCLSTLANAEGNRISGTIDSEQSRIVFDETSLIQEALKRAQKNETAAPWYLRLEYKNPKAKQVHVGLHGACSLGTSPNQGYWEGNVYSHRLDAWKWPSISSWKSFLSRLSNSNSPLEFWVRTKEMPVHAWIEFEPARRSVASTPPTLKIESSYGHCVLSTEVVGYFENPKFNPSFSHFECSLSTNNAKGKWTRCESPWRFGYVKPLGTHVAQVRSVHSDGSVKTTQYKFLSWPLPKQIIFTKIDPRDEVTSQTTMTLNFMPTRSALAYDWQQPYWTQCAVDQGKPDFCKSPWKITNLTAGRHIAKVWRVYKWGKKYYRTQPTLHIWAIINQKPEITWVETPKEITSSEVAKFVYETKNTTQMSCKLDGQSLTNCASPLTVKVSNGLHELALEATGSTGEKAQLTFQWRVDTEAPILSWKSLVPNTSPTNQTTFHAEAQANEAVTWSCAVDNAGFAPCEGSFHLEKLSAGTHTVRVKAVDLALNTSDLNYAWEIDLTPPVVQLSPINPLVFPTNSTQITFQITTSKASELACELNNQAMACGNPWAITGLSEGIHQVKVLAKDSLGNSSDPVIFTWEVDLTPPQISILSITPQENPTKQTSLTLDWTTNEAATFTCERDGIVSSCAAPWVAGNLLVDGEHHLSLVAKDSAGNSSQAWQYAWVVDTTAPVIDVTHKPSTLSSLPTATFEFTLSEAGNVFCKLDDQAEQSCNSPWHLSGLTSGNHQVVLRAQDSLGNESTWTYAWAVQLVPLEIRSTALVQVTQTTATLAWEITRPVDSVILYGSGGNLNQSLNVPYSGNQTQSATINGLTPGVLYTVRVTAQDGGDQASSEDITFRTPR